MPKKADYIIPGGKNIENNQDGMVILSLTPWSNLPIHKEINEAGLYFSTDPDTNTKTK